jgi:hypothetical protein
MRRDHPKEAGTPGVETSATEVGARREAARHLAFKRSYRTTETTASTLLWDAALMAARRAALALPDDLEDAVVQARAFRLLDESWWRLVDRHDRDRQARLAGQAEVGPAGPSPDVAEAPSAGPHRRARRDDAGMDGP